MGGVLKSNFKEKHWRRVLESKLWKEDQGNIMPILKLSYEYLPAHLKQCFVYCSLFPKDYEFEKKELVRLWMAQGFIDSSENGELMEDKGKTCLNELQSRSFFMRTPEKYYVVHDLLHDLAENVSDGEYRRLEDNVANDEQVGNLKTVRHLYTHAGNLAMVCKREHVKKNLRSLVVIDRYKDAGVLLENVKELKRLRSLVIKCSMRQVPNIFDKLVHLRYLDLRHPESPNLLCKLYHLQVLENPSLPKKCNNLIKLRHSKGAGYIPEFGKLTSLQELEFDVQHENSGHGIRQLRDMEQLRKLEIGGLENVRSKEDASGAKLDSKRRLKKLDLEWGLECETNANPDEVLEALHPHQNLRRLYIYRYPGIKSPSWLDKNLVSNLVDITLCNCSNWKVLPPLGQLIFPKYLHLIYMDAVEHIGPEFYGSDSGNSSGAFPSLESLQFMNMPEWKTWSGVENGRPLFRCLSRLEIIDCPRLRGPLVLPSPLKTLRAASFWLEMSPPEAVHLNVENLQTLTEWVPLESLSFIESMVIIFVAMEFTDEVEKWFQKLTSLRSLCFESRDNLDSLPYMLKNIPSLKVLTLSPGDTESLPEEILPSSLTELHMEGCAPVLRERCRKDGLDWHKISHIPTITIDGEVVQKL